MEYGNLFRGLPEEDLNSLQEISSLESFETDKILVKAGQASTPSSLYVLQENSSVEINQVDGNGNILTVAKLTQGDTCGEMAYLERGPRNASIKVNAGSKLLSIPYTKLEQWLSQKDKRRAVFYENLSMLLMVRYESVSKLMLTLVAKSS